jgi:hypothetical protein
VLRLLLGEFPILRQAVGTGANGKGMPFWLRRTLTELTLYGMGNSGAG